MPEYLVRVAEVPVDRDRRRVVGKQGLCVRDDYRIVVNVKYPRIWRELLGDLMNIAASRQPRSYVYELLDAAATSKEPDRSPEEIPVLPCRNCRIRNCSKQSARSLPIDVEIIFTAKQMVVNSRYIRDRRIEAPDHIVVIGQ
jgi:hypothetical protein